MFKDNKKIIKKTLSFYSEMPKTQRAKLMKHKENIFLKKRSDLISEPSSDTN